jgi:hypothetical protein
MCDTRHKLIIASSQLLFVVAFFFLEETYLISDLFPCHYKKAAHLLGECLVLS